MSGSPWKPIFTALLLIASASHARATPIAGNALPRTSDHGDSLFFTQYLHSFITAEGPRLKLEFHRNRSELRHIGGRKSSFNYLRELVPLFGSEPN